MESNIIKCMLVDDEIEGLDMLESLLLGSEGIEVVAKIEHANNAVREVIDKKPDIVFLDINMPNKSGIEVLKEINNLNLNVRVIFVTAFDHFVFEALKNFAFDYLVKPIDRIELQETLIRYKLEKSKSNNYEEFLSSLDKLNKIKIPVNFGSLFFDPDEIVYFEADGAYTSIVLSDGKIETTSSNIGRLEEKLKQNGFFRISRSLLINLKFINRLDRKTKTCTLVANNNTFTLEVPKKKMHQIDEQIS